MRRLRGLGRSLVVMSASRRQMAIPQPGHHVLRIVTDAQSLRGSVRDEGIPDIKRRVDLILIRHPNSKSLIAFRAVDR